MKWLIHQQSCTQISTAVIGVPQYIFCCTTQLSSCPNISFQSITVCGTPTVNKTGDVKECYPTTMTRMTRKTPLIGVCRACTIFLVCKECLVNTYRVGNINGHVCSSSGASNCYLVHPVRADAKPRKVLQTKQRRNFETKILINNRHQVDIGIQENAA